MKTVKSTKLRTLLTVALAIGTLALTTGCEEITSDQPVTAQGQVDPVGGLEDYLTSQPPANSVGGAVACQCVPKTCTPTVGKDAGVETIYPATGVYHALGKWCFVSESCGTTVRGNNHSCDGTKFAFVQPSALPSWAQGDWRKYKAALAAPAVNGSCGEAPKDVCFIGGYCSMAAEKRTFTVSHGNLYANDTIHTLSFCSTQAGKLSWLRGEFSAKSLMQTPYYESRASDWRLCVVK